MKKLILIFLLTTPFCRAADPNEEAQNALHDENWPKVFELIDGGELGINEPVNMEPLALKAVKQNNFEALQELIHRDVDLNIGWKLPLEFASQGYLTNHPGDNNIRLIKLLLEGGASPDAIGSTSSKSILDYVTSLSSQTNSEKKKELLDLFEQYAVNVKPAKK